jgi:DNA-binding Lrp family transcriptional regulator
MTYTFDEQEKKIVKELIRNPRISDNQLAKNTNIPVKTVNRKRKNLEQKNLLSYFAMINNGRYGTGAFGASKFYIISFKYGISRKQFLEGLTSKTGEAMKGKIRFESKHITFSILGEKDGHLTLMILLQSRQDSDIVEIFNVDILGHLKDGLGQDCVENVQVITLEQPLRVLHNYLIHPLFNNLENGVIRKNWDDDLIYVS